MGKNMPHNPVVVHNLRRQGVIAPAPLFCAGQAPGQTRWPRRWKAAQGCRLHHSIRVWFSKKAPIARALGAAGARARRHPAQGPRGHRPAVRPMFSCFLRFRSSSVRGLETFIETTVCAQLFGGVVVAVQPFRLLLDPVPCQAQPFQIELDRIYIILAWTDPDRCQSKPQHKGAALLPRDQGS